MDKNGHVDLSHKADAGGILLKTVTARKGLKIYYFIHIYIININIIIKKSFSLLYHFCGKIFLT